MSITHVTTPLQGGSFVHLAARIWSGAAVIHRDTDLSAVAGQLPPKTLVGDGDKKLIDPAALNKLDALRKRADAAIRKVGFRFLNGYFVPDSLLLALKSELDLIEDEFTNTALPALVSNLRQLYAEWETKHPQWAQMLKGAQITPQEVEQRCSFGVVIYKAQAADDDASAPINQGLAAAAAGIDQALYSDVADQATAILRDTFSNRTKAGQRALRPVRALADKLNGFAFIDAGVGKLAAVVENALASAPRSGHLDAASLGRVVAALQTLASPTAMAAVLAAAQVPSVPSQPVLAPAIAAAPAVIPAIEVGTPMPPVPELAAVPAPVVVESVDEVEEEGVFSMLV